jgi:hypothetical protein
MVMKIIDRIKELRKLPRQQRERLHQTILWLVVPLVILIWGLSLASTLGRLSNSQDQPPQVLGQKFVSLATRFWDGTKMGFQKVWLACQELVQETDLFQSLSRWWSKLWGRPVIAPAPSLTPVPLPIVSPLPL